MMYTKKTMMVAVATLAVLSAYGPASVHAELKPACTPEQLQAAQAAINDKLIETSCPEIVYVGGNPDYKSTAFCANDACVKAIKKTKKALPKCSYDGVNVRKGPVKLLKACEKLAGGASGGSDDDGDDDKDASASTASDASVTPASSKTPKPSKTPKIATASPTPTTPQEIGKVIGAGSDGSLIGNEIGQPIGPAPEPTTATPAPTTAATNVTTSPSISTSKSSGSATSYGAVTVTTLVAVVTSVVWAAFA